MTKVYSSTHKNMIRACVGPEIMDQTIEEMWPVRRSLNIGPIIHKYGKIISHSAVVATTRKGPVLIEYMGDSHVYVFLCRDFRPGAPVFMQRGFYFQPDVLEGQEPNESVTIKEFAEKMCDFMKGKPFNTFNHNCHYARYYTMRFYGMKSDNPKTNENGDNIVEMAFSDVFRKYAHLSTQYREQTKQREVST